MTRASDDSKISLAIVGRYLTGECSADERARVETWMARVPLAAPVVRLLEGYRANPGMSVQKVDPDVLWGRIRERIGTVEEPRGGRTAPVAGLGGGRFQAQPLRQRAWYIAVGSFVSTALVLMLLYGAKIGHGPRRLIMPPMTYATMPGQRAQITLSDGTHVMLDVASQLQVPADFAQGNRTVRLTGEALFSATHHDRTPLTVIADGTTAQVLGTTFLVRHYVTDTVTTVAVRDGKVSVRGVTLVAHQYVQASRSGMTAVRPTLPDQFAFAAGALVIAHQRLRDAIPDLDRWYDVDIRVADPALADDRLMGEFSPGSPAEIASMLTFLLHVRVEREGRVLTLYQQ